MNNIGQLPLRDIHLPGPVSWWPLAYGWWLALLCAVVFGIFAWWGIKKAHALSRRRRFRRTAMIQLEQIEHAYKQTGNANQLVESLSVLLRRVALSVFPRAEVAGLVGRQWVQRLNASGNSEIFDPRLSELLADAPYRRVVDIDARPLIESCREWIMQVITKRVPE